MTSNQSLKNEILQIRKMLGDYFFRNSLFGFDPYDIYEAGVLKFVLRASHKLPFGFIFRKIIVRFGKKISSRKARSFFGIKPSLNLKGVALVLLGCGPDDSRLADLAVRTILAAAESRDKIRGFGYPFDWSSRVWIPKGTPSIVVTSFVVQALVHYLENFSAGDRERAAIEIILLNAELFVLEDLHQYKDYSGVCLSYTPLDRFRVLNASLLGAVLLALVDQYFQRRRHDRLINSLISFVEARQNRDGSFCYWADEPDSVIDNYHTGFVLRSLEFLKKDYEVDPQKLLEGVGFYFSHFLTEVYRVVDIPDGDGLSTDIHSIAEMILMLHIFQWCDPQIDEISQKIISMAVKEYWNTNFFLRYQINYKIRKDDTPYMRWSQAWMFYALGKNSL